MSPGSRMSVTFNSSSRMSPVDDFSSVPYMQAQANQQLNIGRVPSQSLYSTTNSTQFSPNLVEMRFNYKSVILGFMYLTQIPIIEKAKYMFVLLSQLRPVYETKMFSSKLQTKAQQTITRDDIRYTFQIFINISTTYLPTLSSDAPLQYRDKMRQQQRKWSSHSILYLRSLVARFPDLSAISQKMFIERIKNQQIACVFDHQSLIIGLQRFIFLKQQEKNTGWGSPKSPFPGDRKMASTPQPIQMKKKKNQNSSIPNQDDSGEPSPEFENRRYITSNYIASPSAKGRGDQIFRKTVSPLSVAIRENQAAIQKQKKARAKGKTHEQKKSKTTRGQEEGIYRNRVISQQQHQQEPFISHQNLIVQSDMQNYMPDSSGGRVGGYLSPSLINHSNMMKSIFQEKKILFSKSNIPIEKSQQSGSKHVSRNNDKVKKARTERKAKRGDENK